MIYVDHCLISQLRPSITRRNISLWHILYSKVEGLCKAIVRSGHWAAISGFQHFLFKLCFRRKIERSTLMGMQREVIVSTIFRPFGLTLNDQYIYWTDWATRKIYRANKYDGSGQTAMTTSFPFRLTGIHFVMKGHPQQCSNPCDQFNGGCSHICTPGKALHMSRERIKENSNNDDNW